MIFAAGFGTRMGALTKSMPKPLIPVAGKPLIDHALAIADAAGVQKTVVNLHYFGAKIEAHLAGRNITFAWEKDQILETGGGLKAALSLLDADTVFVMNSDAVWTGKNPLLQLRAAWDPDKMDTLLLLLPRADVLGHTGAGDFLLDEDGRISRAHGVSAPVYLGAQIVKTSVVAAMTDHVFSLGRVWDDRISVGRAFGMMHQGGWCDVGNPAGIELAEGMKDV